MKKLIFSILALLIQTQAFTPYQPAGLRGNLVSNVKRRPRTQISSASRPRRPSLALKTSKPKDDHFDLTTTISLISGQTLLIPIAALIARITHTPHWGFGTGVSFCLEAWKVATVFTLPLALSAVLLDKIEDDFPALQDVTMATQRSVLALLGGTFKPWIGLVASICLGMAAGFGEELLFRGVLQSKLASFVGSYAAVGISSIIFGLLHAVTPLYAFLATVASVYFGGLYLSFGNLAVPILCHAIYDIGALLFAHWQVSRLSPEQQDAVSRWEGPLRM